MGVALTDKGTLSYFDLMHFLFALTEVGDFVKEDESVGEIETDKVRYSQS